MVTERMGMTPAMVEARAAQITAHSSTLAQLASEVQRTGYASLSPWSFGLLPGSLIMTAGSVALAKSAASDILAASEAAQQLLGRLRGEITAQIMASSAAGYATPVMSRSDAERLYRQALTDPSVLDDLGPNGVRAWWNQLTDAERDAFVQAQTLAAGNLDGLPLAVRAEANRYTAIERLGEVGLSPTERAYLRKVRDGEVILVAYDPAKDRIIEAIGLGVMDFRADPDHPTFVEGAMWGPNGELVQKEPPTTVITYVPGTGSDMATFYAEDNYQAFGHGIIQGNEENSVVFVYKGGPFAGDLFEAKDQAYAQGTGATLASFSNALELEQHLNNGRTVAIGHSWGLANITSSEVAGARYDAVVSLAGAWMPDGWAPRDGTTYTHHSYVDWLRGVQGIDNALDPFDIIGSGSFPGDSPAFEQHAYRGPKDDDLIPNNPFDPFGEFGRAKEAWTEQHGLIHDTGSHVNAPAIQNIREDIYAE